MELEQYRTQETGKKAIASQSLDLASPDLKDLLTLHNEETWGNLAKQKSRVSKLS